VQGSIGCNHFAIAEHGRSVRKSEHLVQAMANIDDPDAAGTQRTHRREQSLNIGLREAGGWFVEDKNVNITGQRPGDGDDRLFGLAQLADQFIERQRRAELMQRRPSHDIYCAPVN